MHAPITEPYDIVAVSHDHPDHNAVDMIRGNPEIVRGMEIRFFNSSPTAME